jgi:hypothetical protein
MQSQGSKKAKEKEQPSRYRRPKPNLIHYDGKRKVPYRNGLQVALRLDKIDSRTKIGKTVKALYGFLFEYLGGPDHASAPAIILVDRIVFKSVKLLLYEKNHLEEILEDTPRQYLSLSNSLRSDLSLLAQFAGQKPTTPELMDYLRKEYGKSDNN